MTGLENSLSNIERGSFEPLIPASSQEPDSKVKFLAKSRLRKTTSSEILREQTTSKIYQEASEILQERCLENLPKEKKKKFLRSLETSLIYKRFLESIPFSITNSSQAIEHLTKHNPELLLSIFQQLGTSEKLGTYWKAFQEKTLYEGTDSSLSTSSPDGSFNERYQTSLQSLQTIWEEKREDIQEIFHREVVLPLIRNHPKLFFSIYANIDLQNEISLLPKRVGEKLHTSTAPIKPIQNPESNGLLQEKHLLAEAKRLFAKKSRITEQSLKDLCSSEDFTKVLIGHYLLFYVKKWKEEKRPIEHQKLPSSLSSSWESVALKEYFSRHFSDKIREAEDHAIKGLPKLQGSLNKETDQHFLEGKAKEIGLAKIYQTMREHLIKLDDYIFHYVYDVEDFKDYYTVQNVCRKIADYVRSIFSYCYENISRFACATSFDTSLFLYRKIIEIKEFQFAILLNTNSNLESDIIKIRQFVHLVQSLKNPTYSELLVIEEDYNKLFKKHETLLQKLLSDPFKEDFVLESSTHSVQGELVANHPPILQEAISSHVEPTENPSTIQAPPPSLASEEEEVFAEKPGSTDSSHSSIATLSTEDTTSINTDEDVSPSLVTQISSIWQTIISNFSPIEEE